MDLFTTGPSLNFLSNSTPSSSNIGQVRDKDRNDAQMIMTNLCNNANTSNKAGAPKYSFNKSTSFNRTGKGNSLSYGSGYNIIGKWTNFYKIHFIQPWLRAREVTEAKSVWPQWIFGTLSSCSANLLTPAPILCSAFASISTIPLR